MPLRLPAVFCAIACSVTGVLPAQSAAGDSGRRTIEVQGVLRSYLLHLPAPRSDGAMPLLVVFHGGGGTASNIAEHTGLTPAATSRGYAVVYPDGVNGHWSDGRAARAGADDVGFVRLLLDSLRRELPVDPRRIFATGISNGAGMAFRLSCDLPGTFAAIAPVAGALPAELETRCTAASPVSLLMFIGTADPLMPYDGGDLTLRRGRILPATATARLFARVNGCAPAHTVTAEPDTATDGTRVRRLVYGGCRGRRDVVLVRIEGGGHTWPGGPPVGRSVGRVSRDIDANRTMLDFFDRHPRPE
ncbi:MAG TPA: PHB depolymerase family esterase [Gemmatimonadales bacterium]